MQDSTVSEGARIVEFAFLNATSQSSALGYIIGILSSYLFSFIFSLFSQLRYSNAPCALPYLYFFSLAFLMPFWRYLDLFEYFNILPTIFGWFR
jgi:hypothetical protein